MKARRAAHLVAGAFLAFTAWEIAQHVWLMDLPTTVYHMLSLTVDLLLVLLIALAALAIVRRHDREELRHRAIQEAVVKTLADDLRPPLVSLLAQLRAVRTSSAAETRESTRELLKNTEAHAAVLLDMIEDLVAMAEEVEQPAPPCANLSLSEVVVRALEAFRPVAEDRGVTLSAEVPPELPSACITAEAALRALSVLLAHALKATPRGGAVRLQLTHDESENAISFAVSDTARPLLERSARIEDVMARQPLPEMRHVQALAGALGGSVRYGAKPGGNTFTLSLPASTPDR